MCRSTVRGHRLRDSGGAGSVLEAYRHITRYLTGLKVDLKQLQVADGQRNRVLAAFAQIISVQQASVATVPGPSRLPSVPEHFVGREEILKSLDSAWNTESPEPKINLVSIVAWGGVGKSALVGHWLSNGR